MPPDQREILDRWEQNMIEELGKLNNYFNFYVCLSVFERPIPATTSQKLLMIVT